VSSPPFTTQLRAVATQLAGDPVDGPCDDDCVCLHDPTDTVTITLGVKRAGAPIACTLGATDLADRLVHWDRLLATAVRRLALVSGGIRVELPHDVAVAALATLVQAEQACCAFFRFGLTIDDRGVALEIDAPPDAVDLVAGMFGPPS
jgi:MerR family transcriptional regulator, copper efflux regulator